MIADQNEIMAAPGRDKEVQDIPAFATEKELSAYVLERHPDRGANIVALLQDSIRDEKKKVELIDALHLAGYNGKAEVVASQMLENIRQLRAKEGWVKWSMREGWEKVKWTWKKTFVEHPYLSTAVVATVALIIVLKFTPVGGMATGYLTQQARALINQIYPGLEGAEQVAQAAAEKAGEVMEAGKEAGSGALDALKDAAGGAAGGANVPPVMPSPTVPPIPAPPPYVPPIPPVDPF